ncbi:hypothetical protein ABDD95_07020 [Mucilaginibacter sp. PAMB04274]|uniref:hypothetical protein n=1 Tax=Mucilaginibacter sp. PAMB04274 TaxID=3138568 RepID=UPI0031F6E98B
MMKQGPSKIAFPEFQEANLVFTEAIAVLTMQEDILLLTAGRIAEQANRPQSDIVKYFGSLDTLLAMYHQQRNVEQWLKDNFRK